jgi:hypothetical protein
MSKMSITFDLDSSDYTAELAFDAMLNDVVVFSSDHVAAPESVIIGLPDNDGEYELKFVLKNKLEKHTAIDLNKNIVKDAVLTVSNVTFDEIKLGHMFTKLAVYNHDHNGTTTVGEHKFYGDMGCNGYVSLKFTAPIYLWLLENM